MTAPPMTVGELMTRKVLAVYPSTPIEHLILLLVDEDINAVPVLDAKGRPIGIVSKTDLVLDDYDWAELRDEALATRRGGDEDDELHIKALFASRTVADIMSGRPITVTERTGIVEAAQLMVKHSIHGCPVVCDEGVLMGMITAFDVMTWVAKGGPAAALTAA